MADNELGPVLTKTMTRLDRLQAENAELRRQLEQERTAIDAWMEKTRALQRRISVLKRPAPPAEPDAAALRVALRAAVIDFFTYREIDIEEADGWPVSQRARDRRLVKWNEWIDQWLAARAAAAEEADA